MTTERTTAHVFEKGVSSIVVIWASHKEGQPTGVRMAAVPADAVVRNIMGNTIDLAERDRLVLSEEPVYLVLPSTSAGQAVKLWQSSDFCR